MTPDDVHERLADIYAVRDDDEAAHAREDDLYIDVLTAIADGAPHPAALADQALRSRGIEFSRWCG